MIRLLFTAAGEVASSVENGASVAEARDAHSIIAKGHTIVQAIADLESKMITRFGKEVAFGEESFVIMHFEELVACTEDGDEFSSYDFSEPENAFTIVRLPDSADTPPGDVVPQKKPEEPTDAPSAQEWAACALRLKEQLEAVWFHPSCPCDGDAKIRGGVLAAFGAVWLLEQRSLPVIYEVGDRAGMEAALRRQEAAHKADTHNTGEAQ